MVDSTHVDTLLATIKCDVTTCPNRDAWCYILDHVHLKILPQHMKSWSMAINNGVATLNTPPADLIKALMPSRNGTKNPLRNPDPESLKLSKSASTSTPFAPPPYPYPMPPYPFCSPYGPSLPQTPTHGNAGVSVNEPVDLQSSPLASEGDQGEKLMNYIDWLVTKTPSLTGLFTECKDALRKGGHTFKFIKNLTDAQFEKMGISDGLVMQLRLNWTKYYRLSS